MNKEQIIERYQRYLANDIGSEQIRKYHPIEISKIIADVYNDILYEICRTAITDLDYMQLDSYSMPYYVNVLYDARRKEKYFKLPTSIVNLPKNQAIRLICPEQSQEDYYTQSSNNVYKLLNKLDITIVSNRGKWYQEGSEKIFLCKRNIEDIPETLLTRLVIPFDAFSDTDEFPIGGGKATALYQGVLKLLMGKPQSDEINDNSNKHTK